jgi:hypothetical protein
MCATRATATNTWLVQVMASPVDFGVGTGGHRSRAAPPTQQILAGVVHTERLRGLDVRAVLVDLLRARQPIVGGALAEQQ